ncbi:hypothetical protein QJS66_01760 [Kocuria rhizophila]|nr:hypothetical protein QJS66_01760 [Kocuria rhizophila]
MGSSFPLTSIENSINENTLRSIVDTLGRIKAQGVEVVFVSSARSPPGSSPWGCPGGPGPRGPAGRRRRWVRVCSSPATPALRALRRHGGAGVVTAGPHAPLAAEERAPPDRAVAGPGPAIVNENDAVATHEIKFVRRLDRGTCAPDQGRRAAAALSRGRAHTCPPKDGGERIPTATAPHRGPRGRATPAPRAAPEWSADGDQGAGRAHRGGVWASRRW